MTKATPDQERRLRACFRMPKVQTIMSRTSSITNAAVNAIIPLIEPSAAEIAEALEILGMSPDDVQCSYCGDKSSEWDHLRPLVVDRRPTGYISEIGNLVPSCGKCNQSKGNKIWKAWMLGDAPLAPARRGIPDLELRIERLAMFEKWRPSEPIPVEAILGSKLYAEYWRHLERVITCMRECHKVSLELRLKIAEEHRRSDPPTSQ